MQQRLFITLLSLSIYAHFAWSQPYCAVRNFSLRDGLAATMISQMQQTSDGIIWFATWNGLCYFDGYRFTTFRNNQKNSGQLSTNRLLKLQANSLDNLWCITFDLKLYLFVRQESRFLNVSDILRKKTGIDTSPRWITTTPNGHTWVMTSKEEDTFFCITDSLFSPEGDGIEVLSKKRLGIEGCNITKVMSDDERNEWIFSDKGLVRHDDTCAEHGRSKIEATNVFHSLQQMKDKVFFAGNFGSLYYYIKGEKQLRPLTLPPGTSKVSSICAFDVNKMLIATDRGIMMLNTDKMQLSSVVSPDAIVTELYLDSKKRVWAFDENNEVSLIMPLTNEITPLHSIRQWLPGATQSTFSFWHQDHLGTVWLAPRKGVFCYYDEGKQQLMPYMLQFEGSSFNVPYMSDKPFIDRQDNMWFMGSRDLAVANFMYRNITITPTMRGLPVRSLAVDSQGRILSGDQYGHIFVGTNGTQLGFMTCGGQVSTQPVLFSDRGGVYSIFLDSKQRLWIGTKGNGLFLYYNGSMHHFVNNSSDVWSLSNNNVYAIDEDDKGNIWIGTFGGGINKVLTDSSTYRFVNINNQLRRFPKDRMVRIRRITHTRDGVILASCGDGLMTFSNKYANYSNVRPFETHYIATDTTSLLSNDVMQTLVMTNGKIFVATLGGGIQQITSNNLLADNLSMHSMQQFDNDEGNIQSLIEDANGNTWIMHELTIARLDGKTGRLTRFGPGYLDDKCEFTEAAPYYDKRNDRLYAGIVGGYLSLSPKKMNKQPETPDIVFTTVQHQGQQSVQLIMGHRKLVLPADQRNVTITFSAIDYTDNYLLKYAYKIEEAPSLEERAGAEAEWNYTGTTHSASLNNLPAGHYRLIVKSTNSDGEWMDNEQTLDIFVSPTFWETIWAKLLYLTLFAALVAVAVYIYYLHSQNRIQQQVNDTKTRFFTDMGHKLRTPLTLIGGPATEILNEADSVSDNTRSQLQMIQRNSCTMLQMVNDMLDYNPSTVSGQTIENKNYFVDDVNIPVFTSPTVEAQTEVEGSSSPLSLLVIEDNAELRAFLSIILSKDYNVVTAVNGREGLQTAKETMPNFIITDVMMPEMDGLTMVHQIKQDPNISHIPIIVLSAKASLEDRLAGLQEGIDDYITKPFSATYLIQRVNNIISQRRILQQQVMVQFSSAVAQAPKPADEAPKMEFRLDAPQIIDLDKQMMDKVKDYLDKHIGDESLRIEDIASAVGLSHIVFIEKIKSIVGMVPVEFLRTVRMQRAEELITKSNYTISEVAYAVGFNDPKYFSKCFKNATGMSPSEYRKKAQKE